MKKERILKMAWTDLFFLFKNTKREFISLIEEKKSYPNLSVLND